MSHVGRGKVANGRQGSAKSSNDPIGFPRILGKTPFTLQLDRMEGQRIEFSKEGYKPITMKLTTTTNGAFWCNILLDGLVGSTTDGISGAIYEYSPSQFFVTLNQEVAPRLTRERDNHSATKPSPSLSDATQASWRTLVKALGRTGVR